MQGNVLGMSTPKRTVLSAILAAALASAGHAETNDRIPGHQLFADDGDQKAVEGPVTFAVIGNTRGSLRALDSRGAVSGVTQELLADLQSTVGTPEGPSFLVMMGDHVRTGSTLEWRRFNKRFSGLLLSESLTESSGLACVPVAGDRESFGDERLFNWSSAFPEVGQDIGFNRTASWYFFDLRSAAHTWRVVVLDSGKARLGSRWREQLSWLSAAVYGRYDSLLVFMHDPLLDLSEGDMNADGAPQELIEAIEEEVSLLQIRAVFSAGSHASQAILPDGPFGSLYINAGGGGAPAQDLRRWGAATEASREGDIHLEPMFDLSLQNALTAWSDENAVPEAVLQEARGSGSFEGFVASLSAKHMPTYGWWTVTLEGEQATARFRHRMPDGTIEDRYRIDYTREDGWRGRAGP